jgi:hypothetical protein
MNTYPADEQTISDVECGRCCRAVVLLPAGTTLAVGDAVLFAHSHARAGQQPAYVKGGDSILVCLAEVTDLGRIDPATGQALVQLTWKPLGRGESSANVPRRGVEAFGSREPT